MITKEYKKDLKYLFSLFLIIMVSYEVGWIVGNRVNPREIKVSIEERAIACNKIEGDYIAWSNYGSGYGFSEKCEINKEIKNY